MSGVYHRLRYRSLRQTARPMVIPKLFRKLAFVVPLGVLVMSVNAIVDPAHLFNFARHETYEEGIARWLLAGFNIEGASNYNDRLMHKYYVAGLIRRPDVIILGSSRALQIRSTGFGDKVVFNHGVTNGNLEDAIAIYELYHTQQLTPTVVLLNLDPWLLDHSHSTTAWQALQSDYETAARRMGLKSSVSPGSWFADQQKYLELISPAYFQQSITMLGRTILLHQTNDYIVTTTTQGDQMIRLADGSLVYNGAVRLRSDEAVRAAAQSDALTHPVAYLDAERQSLLVTFITALQADGVELVFMLSPFHPLVYETWEAADYTTVRDAQSYYEALAHDYHIALIGSYNPADVDCGEAEFYDGLHPREACLQKILATLNQN